MNINNKKFNVVGKIILIFLFFICIEIILKTSTTYAAVSKAQVGEYIAEFSRNFAASYSNETAYSWDAQKRGAAYNGQKTSGYTSRRGQKFTDKYAMDCVGWVSFAIHHSTGLDSPVASSGSGGFVVPQSNLCSGSNGYFEIVKGNPQPGDILIVNDRHVMVYVGNNQVVDSWNRPSGAVQLREGSAERSYYGTLYNQIARISDEGVKAINEANLTTVFDGQGSISGSCYGDSYDYQGLKEGTYGYEVFDMDWILNKLSEILDWFVGIVTYLIRAIFVGWTSIIEGLINSVVEWTTGEEASLTVEKIVNNKVAILDVNFFNFKEAGGITVEEDSVIYVIRENIAVWYYIIRSVSIIGLLITLLYLGIRMALATVGEEKAKYKQLLVNWLVSFIIVFFIHYIMIIILNINESLIKFINIALGGGEESLYDSVRNGAYAIQASVGWSSLIMYIMLVYLLVKFVFMYFKRFLVVGILTFMAPIIGVTYSIDKIKDNKSQSLSNWLKEYTFNVLIQSVHCLLYTLMLSLAFNVVGKSIQGTLLALFLIGFILKAEVIFKKIFGIKSGQLQDAIKSTAAALAAGTVMKNFVRANVKATKLVTKPVRAPVNKLAEKTKMYNRMDKVDKVKQAIDKGATKVQIGKKSYNINELISDKENFDSDKIANEIFNKHEEEQKNEKKEIKNLMQQTLNTIKGTAQAAVATPMIFLEPEKGIVMVSKARGTLKNGINGYNEDKQYYTGKGKGVKNLLTAGLYKNTKNLIGHTSAVQRKLNNNNYNAQHEIASKLLQGKIDEEYDRLHEDVNIDEKELDKVLKNAKKMVPEEKIMEITYIMQAFLENDVTIKVTENGVTTREQTSLNAQVNKLADSTTDINSLHQQAKQMIKANKNTVKVDQEKFEKNVQSELIKLISKEKDIRRKDVTKSDIDKKFKEMDKKDKKRLMKDAMVKSTELAEKAKKSIDEQKTNMKLENVNEIIDSMKKMTKVKINRERYKKNFEDLIKGEIQEKKGIEFEKISQSDMDNYIADLTNIDLMQKIKEAGAMENSLEMSEIAKKAEYSTLVDIIQKQNYHKSKMKGKD